MKIGQYFTSPTQSIHASLAIGSAPQNWLSHLEPSLSWLYLFSYSQEQCIHSIVRFKPKLCRGQLYGEYLNELTHSTPIVNKKTEVTETYKKQILKNVRHKPKNARNSLKTNVPEFQTKNLTSTNPEASKPKISKTVYLPKSLKPEVSVAKLQQWTEGQNFQATLANNKKQQQYFRIKLSNPKPGSLRTKPKFSKKISHHQLNDTDRSGWVQSICHRASDTLHNNKQARGLAQFISTDNRKYSPFNFADSDISDQVQTITYGKRASYALLADNSGLFESTSSARSSTTSNAVVDENSNVHESNGSLKPQAIAEKPISKEQVFYQDLYNDLKQRPILPTHRGTKSPRYQEPLSDAENLPQPVLQHDTDPEQLLNRLLATEEKSTSAPLPTRTEQQSTNGENEVTTANHRQAQLADAGLPELASRVKRILDEQARRHGIDV